MMFMKNTFTFLRNHKKLLLVAVVSLMSTVRVSASTDEGFYNYWVHLGTYPTGAGKVYAEIKDGSVVAEDADFRTPAESVEVKYMKKDLSTQSFDAYAQPADGWIVAGFTLGTRNDDGTFTAKPDTLINKKNPASISPKSTISDKDSLTAISIFPIEADTAYFAVFTHVKPNLKDGHENFGSVSIDKISNDIGDKVTLTATPREDANAQFAYWVESSTGKKLTDNPLTVDVTKAEEYFAYFESDLMETITFPEGGGWLPYHTDCYVLFPDVKSFKVMVFNNEGVTKFDNNGKEAIACVPDDTGYFAGTFAGTQLLYGEGTQVAKRSPENTDPNTWSVNFLRWSGDEGVKTDTLPTGHHYYTFDVNSEVFNIVGANIAAKQVYMAMPDSCVEALTPGSFPEVIYTKTDGSQTGIASLKADPTMKSKGVYTLDGRRIDAMDQKGIYIFDGKKVLYRKK